MLFNSNAFYVFLPIVFAVYWLFPQRLRWIVLFISSYYFYMSWEVKYVTLILLTTVVSYGTALLIERTEDKRKKKACLMIALVISLGVLFFFKYFNFLSSSVTAVLQKIAIPLQPFTLDILLPVGISFYTFQTLSYVIDVYRGEVKACRHFGKYATFISFFPQLVAGPIERTRNLLPQIEQEHTYDYDKGIAGAKMIAWGFFKKIAIADTVAGYVDMVYNHVDRFTGLPLIAATFLFAFQIYCDFSGYSDIAIGVAKLFDIDLMTNFKSPYFAASIKEFWGRWHISLSTWFKDYVYIPLGGNRRGEHRTRFNLMVTFLVSGLWHGANWTYVLWGAIHGAGQVLERVLDKVHTSNKKRSWLRVGITFLFVCFAWIFFRANSIADALYVVKNLFTGLSEPITYVTEGFMAFRMASLAQTTGMKDLLICVCCILILLFHDYIELETSIWVWICKYRKPIRYALYFLLLFASLTNRMYFYNHLLSIHYVVGEGDDRG